MRRILTALFVIAVLVPGVVLAVEHLPTNPSKYVDAPSFMGYVPNEFIVVLKDNVAVDHAKDAMSDRALSRMQGFDALAKRFDVVRSRPQFPGSDRGARADTPEAQKLAHYYKVRIDYGTLEDAMAAYEEHPLVDHVEPIGIHVLRATPNDGYYDDPPPEFPYDQWHYWDTYGIEADMAWDKETGDATVVVGVLDSGVKYDHGDLGGSNPPGPNDVSTNGNIWINSQEIVGNSIDDDGNGYVDDVIGWDFVERTDWYIYSCVDLDCGGADNDPFDGNGHGTHVSGTIAAITNNGYAVAGIAGGYGDGTFAGTVANGVKIVPCRIGYSMQYQGQTVGVVIMDYVAEAMYYMAELKIRGENVAAVNFSAGSSNSGGLSAACDYLIAQDVMVIVAAGNSNSSSADYLGARTDCMDVGATDVNGNPASFSNYGSWVDIAAPGVEIMSTAMDPGSPTSDYVAVYDGTSMSCPHVVGVAALLESYDPSLSAQDKWDLIVNNTKAYNPTKDVGAGIVDVRAAIDAISPPEFPPVAAFVGSPLSGDIPLTVTFTDQSTEDPTSWLWNFGDGNTSTEQNPVYTYTVAGDYTVTLTATNAFGSDDEIKPNYISATEPPEFPPVAAFVGSPLSGEIPLMVTFTDQSTESPTSWLWNFGDGNTSTEQNPVYTYTVAGDYTVTLTATNAFGSDDEIKPNYVSATEPPEYPPVADFVGSPTSGYAPLTVNFSDLSTENPTSWLWEFGDGNTSVEQNPTHIYADLGIYTVTLTATNAYGSDGETKVDYITVSEQQPFEQVFALSDIPVAGTVSGSYVNTFTSDNGYESITEVAYTGHPVKTYSFLEHKWNFNVGGGTDPTFYLEAYRPDNADGDNFIFEYSTDDITYLSLVTVANASEQVYSVALPGGTTGTVYVRVRDSNHGWSTNSMDIVYIDQMYIEYSTTPAPPVANFAGAPVSGNVPLTVNFTDLSTGAPDTWAWNFGDGGTSTAQNPSHQYLALGQYTVTLTATNAYGSDVETKTNYINVTEAGTTMHVQNMTVGRAKAGPNYFGTCTVLMYESNSNPVLGATVYVTATGPTSGTYNGVTGADGTVSFQAPGMKKPVGEWCFEVTNATHATLTYDAGANVVTMACESGPVFKNGEGIAELLPSDFTLGQNRPNPFNPATEIAFSLPQATHVTLHIYNIAGQKVATLVDEMVSAGTHVVQWDASTFSSGVYLYRLQADTFVETKKMILLK